jgi:hypothetical protein
VPTQEHLAGGEGVGGGLPGDGHSVRGGRAGSTVQHSTAQHSTAQHSICKAKVEPSSPGCMGGAGSLQKGRIGAAPGEVSLQGWYHWARHYKGIATVTRSELSPLPSVSRGAAVCSGAAAAAAAAAGVAAASAAATAAVTAALAPQMPNRPANH